MKKDKASRAPAGEGHGWVASLASRSAFGPEAWGPLAAAWAAFHGGRSDAELLVHGDDGASERMPVSIFFRGTDGLRPVDEAALDRVRGKTLDGGAGVGSVALILQSRGFRVTAAEVIPEGVAIMRERGLEDVRPGRVQDLPAEEAYDTILLLMNGTALAGTLAGFPSLLGTLAGLLASGGQVLMDSTDLLDRDRFGGHDGAGEGFPGSPGDPYPGEVQYQLEFEGNRGAPFPQLFLDPVTLRRLGTESGWSVEVVWEGEDGEYLARLTLGR